MSQVGSSIDFTAISSAARTSPVTGSDLENLVGATGIILTLDLTAISGTSPTVAVQLQMKDTASGKYFTLFQGATQSSTGTYAFVVYPSAITTGTNAPTGAGNGVLPRTYRINTVHGGVVTSATYSVGAVLID
jgi:hypothetical protein